MLRIEISPCAVKFATSVSDGHADYPAQLKMIEHLIDDAKRARVEYFIGKDSVEIRIAKYVLQRPPRRTPTPFMDEKMSPI
jgi:hypothetical protein